MIAAPKHIDQVFYEDGDTWDIIRVTFHADNRSKSDTFEISREFEPTKEGLKKLWKYVRHKYHYEEDPEGVQWVQSPARLNYEEVGDCKSMTVFVQSVLQNLNVEYYTRFVSYSEKVIEPTHVYTIAILPTGEHVIIDCVYSKFNKEVEYKHKYDFHSSKIRTFNMTQISYLAGHIGNAASNTAIQQEINNLKTFDFVNATEAERQEHLIKEFHYLDALHNKNRPVVATASLDAMTKVHIPRTAANSQVLQPEINGIIDWAKRQAKKLKEAFVRNISKVILPRMAAFFTYVVVDDKLLSPKAKAKKARVMKVVNIIKNAAGMSQGTFNLIIVNGLKSRLNKLPDEVVKSLYPNRVGELVATITAISAAVGAIGGLVAAISKVVKSFKAGDVSKDDAPSPDDFTGFNYGGSGGNTNTPNENNNSGSSNQSRPGGSGYQSQPGGSSNQSRPGENNRYPPNNNNNNNGGSGNSGGNDDSSGNNMMLIGLGLVAFLALR